MNTKTERLEDNKVKFEITIDAKTVDEAIDAVYKQVNKNTRIPGFRKGKAPKTVLEHNFGAEYFTSMATANLIEEYSPAAVDDADFIALRDYEYDTDDAIVENGKDYTYSFTIVIKPELSLSSIDPVEVELPSPVATDEEIDAQIDLLRSYYIDLESVDDRPVQEDDIVSYSRTCEINGKEIEEGKEEKTTHVIATGENMTDLDKALVGTKIAQTTTVDLPSSELGLEQEYPLVQITCKLTVLEITEKKMPELTDEWVKNTSDAEDVAGLRKQVGESIAAEKESRIDRNKSIECLEVLAERLEGEPTEEVIRECQNKALRNLYANLEAQGITLDQYLMFTGHKAEDFMKDIEEQGKMLAKQDMALDALAKALGCDVTEEDIDTAFKESNLDDPAATRKQWEQEHRMATLREEIRRDKAAKWLYENAKVTFVDPNKSTEKDKEAGKDKADEKADKDKTKEKSKKKADDKDEKKAEEKKSSTKKSTSAKKSSTKDETSKSTKSTKSTTKKSSEKSDEKKTSKAAKSTKAKKEESEEE